MASSSSLIQVTELAQRLSFILTSLGFGIPKSLWAFLSAAMSYYLYDDGFSSSFVIFSLNVFLAILSLLCISRNLKVDGIKKFMFLDELSDRQLSFLQQYIKTCNGSFYAIFWCVIVCFALRAVHGIICIPYITGKPLFQSILIQSLSVALWTYLHTIFLSTCILFNLVCKLPVISFIDFDKFLVKERDAAVCFKELIDLSNHLSKISGRFSSFLLISFFVINASQLFTLFHITDYHETVNIINGGDFVISSIVQAIGFVLCLHAASTLSKRVQGISSVVSGWHANQSVSSSIIQSRTNSESMSHAVLYLWREAIDLYTQASLDGFTVYGCKIDSYAVAAILLFEVVLAVGTKGFAWMAFGHGIIELLRTRKKRRQQYI